MKSEQILDELWNVLSDIDDVDDVEIVVTNGEERS